MHFKVHLDLMIIKRVAGERQMVGIGRLQKGGREMLVKFGFQWGSGFAEQEEVEPLLFISLYFFFYRQSQAAQSHFIRI